MRPLAQAALDLGQLKSLMHKLYMGRLPFQLAGHSGTVDKLQVGQVGPEPFARLIRATIRTLHRRHKVQIDELEQTPAERAAIAQEETEVDLTRGLVHKEELLVAGDSP